MNLVANKISSIIKWAILLFTGLICIFDGRSENYITSSGILSETMFNGPNIVAAESSSNEFSATISTDGKWAIDIHQIYKRNEPMYGKEDSIYMTFDGSDTYYCQYSEAVIGITNGRPGFIGTAPIASRSQWSYISAGNYPFAPFDTQKRTHILWLVYGAGKNIRDSKSESMPLPWMPARWNLLSYGFRLQAEISPVSPYIPTSLQFIRDSKLDFKNEQSEYDRPELDQPDERDGVLQWQNQLNQRTTKWRDGAVAGRLKVGTFTNVDGLSVPLSFSFETYFFTGSLRRTYTATITNITTKQIDNLYTNQFRPPILSRLSVLDSRFRFRDGSKNVNSIYYTLEDTQSWQPIDSTNLQRKFKSFYAAGTRRHFSILPNRTKHVILIIAFSALTILPMAFALRNSLRSPPNKNN